MASHVKNGDMKQCSFSFQSTENEDKTNEEKKQTMLGTAWQNCRRMIYVQRSAQKGFFGHWPIPESFWPDLNSTGLVREMLNRQKVMLFVPV
jgi:hypothetical protein